MRILQIINSIAIADGGPARNSYELGAALDRLPHVQARAIVIQNVEGTSIEDATAFRRPPAHVRFLKLWTRRSALDDRTISAFQALRSMSKADIVIIHGYFLWWTAVAAAIASGTGARVYLTPHGSLTSHQQRSGRAKKALFEITAGRLIRRSLTSFVVGSEAERVDVKSYARSVETSVGGVGTLISDHPTPTIPDATVRMISISRIAPKKRIDLMIDAAFELRQSGWNVDLTIAGDGEPNLKAILQKQVREYRLEESVHFVGQVSGENKEALYSADIFLAPSDDENFGIAPAEALAHGVSCVASTAVASLRDMPPDAGRRLDHPTGVTIAASIKDLLSIPEEQRRGAALTFASETFSWEVAARAWLRAMDA